jgi:2-methylisocitrate lyase-like PEP mutase family enzyme
MYFNTPITTMNNYKTFYELHYQETPLLLANAWNVKSAQLIAQNGYGAVGTSSGAISNSLGYEDGEKMPFSELLYIVQRIKASINIPLSVDLERGYTNDLAGLEENIQKLADIGVAGINLEDAQGEEIYLKKLATIKNYLAKNNLHIFINARTDGFLQKVDAPLETTIARAKRYRDAGADGIFVTGVSDPSLIKEIAASISLPLNIVGTPKLSSIKTLTECGVRRISMAVFPYKATYNVLDKLLKTVITEQSFEPLF